VFGTVGVFLGAGVGGECDGDCDPVWFHGVVVWWFECGSRFVGCADETVGL
jgi:hypothetical protein